MTSVANNVAWWARHTPERTALIYGELRLSYGELQRNVAACAGLLQSRGIRPGDVVALLMKNSPAFLELALAVYRSGAVLLPLNYRLGTEEILYILDHAQAKLLFADHDLAAVATGSAAEVIPVDPAAQHEAALLAGDIPPLPIAHPARADDLCRLMYTSGTTDRPKGVMHSHANIMWKSLDHIAALELSAHDRLLVTGPLYHVGAFDLPGLAIWIVGGSLALLRDFDSHAVLGLIERERLTGGWMAPVMLDRCLACEDRQRYELSSFRWLIGGGERTPESRIREFGELFPAARYIDAYGLTETCSGDTMMPAGHELERIGSTGRALAHVEVSIRDAAGQPVPAGQAGEICLRGPKVTLGYWQDPARTTASFFGDWFRSGDIGRLDEAGFLTLTDRKKDMIISGGENIASSEVERVLYQLPAVAEAAVIGLPDPRWGERVVAVVVMRPGESLDLTELRRHCEGRLGGFKTPRQLILRASLPRNPSGKVLKRLLREELAEHGGD